MKAFSKLRAHKGEAIALLSVFALLLGSALAYAFWPKKEAGYADLVVYGKLQTSLRLEGEYDYALPLKEGDFVVRVEGGGIKVKSAPCLNRYCERQGFKSKDGDCIICAYLGVSILLHSDAPVGEISV